MTDIWITIGVLAVTTAFMRAAGPVFLGGRNLPGAFRSVIALVAPALLASLVVVETLSAPEGGAFEIDARLAGVTVAGIALLRGVSILPVIAIAALVTAGIRLIAG